MPIAINVTVLNGLGVSGHIVGKPKWHPYTKQQGHRLDVSIQYSPVSFYFFIFEIFQAVIF